MNRRSWIGYGFIAGSVIYGLTIISEYADIPLTKTESGRTKNSIATVVSGIIANKMYDNSKIELEVQKQSWPDSKITGETTDSTILSYNDLSMTSAKFTAQKNRDGKFEGKVDKSEFNWDITQTGNEKYHVGRFGLKFDADLEIKVSKGKITGEYQRHGIRFNWDIEGIYDSLGNVNINIDGPMNLGINLVGKITKR
jgi:hypothetical protein